jgi:hypothetical protein
MGNFICQVLEVTSRCQFLYILTISIASVRKHKLKGNAQQLAASNTKEH